jgi:hypothetical protein
LTIDHGGRVGFVLCFVIGQKFGRLKKCTKKYYEAFAGSKQNVKRVFDLHMCMMLSVQLISKKEVKYTRSFVNARVFVYLTELALLLLTGELRQRQQLSDYTNLK